MDLAPNDIPLPLLTSSPSWLARLRTIAEAAARALGSGDVLLREGERPTRFWAIQSGAIALTCTSRSGRRATVAVLGREGVLGEEAMAPTPVHSDPDSMAFAEARALVATTAWSIPFPALRLAMAADPRLARWVALAVSRRAGQVQRTLARTLAMRVPERLLGVLQDLAAQSGTVRPGGVLIGLPLTQDLLASMVGATRESVNRAIADLERQGLVRRAGLRYVVVSSPGSSGGDFP